MHAIWSGAIGFGLVNIPVKAYSATTSSRIDLDMLDAEHHAPIRFARISTATGEEVPWPNVVKGYKYNDERYIVLEPEDFAKVRSESSKLIDIVDFVELKELDSVYFEKPYFLEPAKMAGKPYRLLHEALAKSKKVGIATYVFRDRAALGVVKPYRHVIVLNQIRYPSELRDINELKIPEKTEVRPQELDMALALIDKLTVPFDPSRYHDTFNEELMALIEKKAAGKPIKSKAARVHSTKVTDIAALLKASLAENRKRAKPHRRRSAS